MKTERYNKKKQIKTTFMRDTEAPIIIDKGIKENKIKFILFKRNLSSIKLFF